MPMPARIRQFLAADDDASATVEFVLWVPVFVLIMALVVDTSRLMVTQTRFYDVARDAARQVALGKKSTGDAESAAQDALTGMEAARISAETDAEYAIVTVSVPFAEVISFGDTFVGTAELTAQVRMLREDLVAANN